MLKAQVPTIAAVRNAMYDPVVCTVVQKLREELSATKIKLEETQNELSAWKFTPDRYNLKIVCLLYFFKIYFPCVYF